MEKRSRNTLIIIIIIVVVVVIVIIVVVMTFIIIIIIIFYQVARLGCCAHLAVAGCLAGLLVQGGRWQPVVTAWAPAVCGSGHCTAAR